MRWRNWDTRRVCRSAYSIPLTNKIRRKSVSKPFELKICKEKVIPFHISSNSQSSLSLEQLSCVLFEWRPGNVHFGRQRYNRSKKTQFFITGEAQFQLTEENCRSKFCSALWFRRFVGWAKRFVVNMALHVAHVTYPPRKSFWSHSGLSAIWSASRRARRRLCYLPPIALPTVSIHMTYSTWNRKHLFTCHEGLEGTVPQQNEAVPSQSPCSFIRKVADSFLLRPFTSSANSPDPLQ